MGWIVAMAVENGEIHYKMNVIIHLEDTNSLSGQVVFICLRWILFLQNASNGY